MQLTVLGSGAACPPPGQNSSGYLVEEAGTTLLLDCGHGVASTLFEVCPSGAVDHILITHMHVDHFIDIVPIRFHVTRDMEGVPERRVHLHLPPGGVKQMHALLDAINFPAQFFSNTFAVNEYDPKHGLRLGALGLEFAEAKHYIPAWAVRVNGSSSITYSGDTAPCEAVAALGRDTDLFVCEATLAEAESGPVRGHCTPEQAGGLAADGGVRRLLLSHFWCGQDPEEFGRRARATFPGPVETARDGVCIRL